MSGFDGAGNYVRNYNWTQDAANAIPIMASRFDTEDNGFASAFGNCLTRDGQGKASADFIPGANGLYSVGSNATKWKDGFFSGTVSVGGLSLYRGTLLVKAGDTTRASTTTPSNDPDLAAALSSAGTYKFEVLANIYGNTATTNGIVIAVNYSGSFTSPPSIQVATGNINASGILISSQGVLSNANSSSSSLTFSTISASNPKDWILITGYLIATSSGTFGVNWAQASSNVTGTSLRAGSYLLITRIL